MPKAAAAPCILIVDEEDPIRIAVAEALELESYRVASARNGTEALELVAHHRPSAIVLDLMMPVMNGRQFLERCRAELRCKDTPVLVMSAYRKLPDEAASLGVKGCLTKPFDLDVLLGAVERLERHAR